MLQVEELQQQVQQLKAERDRAQLHLQIAQQQQRLHASLSAGAANNSGGSSSSTLPPGAGAEQFLGSSSLSAAALAGTRGSPALEAAFGSMGAAVGAPVPDTVAAVQLACGQPGSVPSMQLQHQAAGLSPAAPAVAGGAGAARVVASSPARAASAAEQGVMAAVQQLKTSLPDAPPVQGQLASLMSAIQAGVQERQVLAAQGRVLLDMLVGSN